MVTLRHAPRRVHQCPTSDGLGILGGCKASRLLASLVGRLRRLLRPRALR